MSEMQYECPNNCKVSYEIHTFNNGMGQKVTCLMCQSPMTPVVVIVRPQSNESPVRGQQNF